MYIVCLSIMCIKMFTCKGLDLATKQQPLVRIWRTLHRGNLPTLWFFKNPATHSSGPTYTHTYSEQLAKKWNEMNNIFGTWTGQYGSQRVFFCIVLQRLLFCLAFLFSWVEMVLLRHNIVEQWTHCQSQPNYSKQGKCKTLAQRNEQLQQR